MARLVVDPEVSARGLVAQEASARELTVALHSVSPRFQRPSVTVRSLLIYVTVIALWIAVTAAAWFAQGVFAWTVGLLYVIYDTWLLIYVARKTRFILHTPPPGLSGPAVTQAAVASADPTIGVIIAAYNEAPALPSTLAALLAQLSQGDVVLVVDDGSQDDTLAMLASRFDVVWSGSDREGQSARYPGLRVWRNPHGGKARALNAGLALLRTDLIVTVDADTKLSADALAGLRRSFAEDPAVVAICCVIRPVCSPSLLSGMFQWFQTYEYMRAFCSRIAWMRSGALLLVSGAFAGFRRSALSRVGGFDPECLVEDYELIHRLHRYSFDHDLGWRVSVLNTARAITDAPGTLASFLRQRRRWFAGFLQTQYWNCDMTFNGRYGAVGRWMLPIKAIDTMQPIFGLTAFGLLITFALLGRLTIVVPVLVVIGTKIAVDIGFHLWWVHLYGRWTGQRATAGGFGMALLSALVEPFSFQLMRHVGAAWGWCSFITRRHHWGVTASLPLADLNAQ